MKVDLFEIILIETRNVCTRKCWFCKFGQERQDAQLVEMGWPLIERILDNLRTLDFQGRLSWFHINEPLVEKRIFDILKLSRAACPKAVLHLNTNGDLLNDRVFARLIEAGLDALGVSVYDEATLAKIRAMKADPRLAILDMRRPNHKVDNRGGNIKINRRVFAGRLFPVRFRSCARPFNMLTVRPNGDVVLCCADMYGDVVMGNAADQKLEEIWWNEKFSHHRETLNREGRQNLALCQNCTHAGHTSSVRYPFDATTDSGGNPWPEETESTPPADLPDRPSVVS